MSDAETRKLFAMVNSLVNQVGDLKDQFEEAMQGFHVVASNSELVYQGYQRYGTAIESLDKRLEQLRLTCPLMKAPTDEFPKV